MPSLQPNPETGFLETHLSDGSAFDSDKKCRFIAAIKACAEKKTYPRFYKLCQALDLSRNTLALHMERDEVFKRAVDEAMLQVKDEVVGALTDRAMTPSGTVAQIFYLKNRYPQEWNDNYQIPNVDIGQLKGLINAAKGFIDAEIVKKDDITSTQKQLDQPTDLI